MKQSPMTAVWGLSPKALKKWGGKVPPGVAQIANLMTGSKETLARRKAVESQLKFNQLTKGIK